MCVCVCVQVLQALQVKFGDLYRQENVVLSGTHTHCGPGGFFQYTLFMISSSGYIKASVQPLVDGIVKVFASVFGPYERFYCEAFLSDILLI